MPLNWNLEKIKDHETVCWIPEGEGFVLDPVTCTLISITNVLKISEITEDTAGEFYARLKLLEGSRGLLRKTDNTPLMITPEMVYAHIGLETNVVSEERHVFFEKLEYELDRLKVDYQRSHKRLEKEAAV